MASSWGFVVVAVTYLTVMTGSTLPTPLYSVWQDEMAFPISTLTAIFAVYAVAVLVALLVVGRLSDAIGRKPVLLLAVLLSALADGGYVLSRDVPSLLLSRTVSGIAAALVVGTATAALVELSPPRWGARAPMVATSVNIAGLGAGPLVSGVFVQWGIDPTRVPFALHTGVLVASAAMVARVPEPAPRALRPPGRFRVQTPRIPHGVGPVFTGAAINAFVGFATASLLMSLSPHIIAGIDQGAPPLVTCLAVFAFFSCSVSAQVGVTVFGLGRPLERGTVLLGGGCLVVAAGVLAGSVPLLVAGAGVAGVGQGASFTRGLASVLEQVTARDRVGVTSAYFVVTYVATSVPVLAEGRAADVWGLRGTSVTFSLCGAGLALVGLVLLVALGRATARLPDRGL